MSDRSETIAVSYIVTMIYDESVEGAREAVMGLIRGASWAVSGNCSKNGYYWARIAEGSGQETIPD